MNYFIFDHFNHHTSHNQLYLAGVHGRPQTCEMGSNAFLHQQLRRQSWILARFDQAVELLIERRFHLVKNLIESPARISGFLARTTPETSHEFCNLFTKSSRAISYKPRIQNRTMGTWTSKRQVGGRIRMLEIY